MRPDILTNSARYFNFITPDDSVFFIEDIASGLSKCCRFAGQTKDDIFYSVAQHSVLASYLVPEEHRFAALMHDASEAFTGDMSKPLKELIPQFKAIEKRIELAIFARFGIDPSLHASIKHADLVMLATEQRDLMMPHDDEWAMLAGIDPLSEKIIPLSNIEARKLFMRRYYEICPPGLEHLSRLPVSWLPRFSATAFCAKIKALVTRG